MFRIRHGRVTLLASAMLPMNEEGTLYPPFPSSVNADNNREIGEPSTYMLLPSSRS